METRLALGHVHIKVRELDRAVAFYIEHLDLEVAERYDRFAFLSWGRRHHDVALQALGPDATAPGDGVGLYHVAFEVDGEDALRSVYRGLREAGVRTSPVDHGISKALYFSDPDGNGIEVYVDTRSDADEDWRGVSLPFDPEESGDAEPLGE
ncbi:VOC family protein [Halosolutus gelatinilyticus]|uniref:VOC family protein n=1 Tax=Halosolutus gelatinilyticus TaxID=2931975 RepID=UPI001FF26D88|nr:VOC family protein [Halosolutus gelatinilyticus]